MNNIENDIEVKNLINYIRKCNKIPMIIIYGKPKDYPEHFVARLFDMKTPTSYIVKNKNYKNLIDTIPGYMTSLGRHPNDDECIISVYV